MLSGNNFVKRTNLRLTCRNACAAWLRGGRNGPAGAPEVEWSSNPTGGALVAWDTVPEQSWLLKLRRKPAFHAQPGALAGPRPRQGRVAARGEGGSLPRQGDAAAPRRRAVRRDPRHRSRRHSPPPSESLPYAAPRRAAASCRPTAGGRSGRHPATNLTSPQGGRTGPALLARGRLAWRWPPSLPAAAQLPAPRCHRPSPRRRRSAAARRRCATSPLAVALAGIRLPT